jgi:4-amino-4-deoxy-L-arabinose transferase-like glycosyltransferase
MAATRILMIYPMAFFFLFGINDFTATVYILIASLGTIFLTYLIGKELFNVKTGLIAASLLAVLPLEVIYATTLVPDVPLAFFLALSVYLFVKATKTKEVFTKTKKVLFLLSGAAIGLGWLVKPMAVVLILFFIFSFLLDLVIKKQKLTSAIKPYILVAMGLIAVLSLEGAMYFALGHGFMANFNLNNEFFITTTGTHSNLKFYPPQLFNLNSLGPYLHYFGFYFYAALLSALTILATKRKQAFVLLIWLFPLLLFLQFSSMSIKQYLVVHKLYRYLIVTSVPMTLLAAYFLANFKLKKLVFALLFLFLMGSSLYYTYYAHVFMVKTIEEKKLSANLLTKLEEKPIYSDPTTIGYYTFLMYHKKSLLRQLVSVKDIMEIQDAYVVVNADRGYVELPALKSRLPDFIFNPPASWKSIGFIKGTLPWMYNTTIYYVPGPDKSMQYSCPVQMLN